MPMRTPEDSRASIVDAIPTIAPVATFIAFAASYALYGFASNAAGASPWEACVHTVRVVCGAVYVVGALHLSEARALEALRTDFGLGAVAALTRCATPSPFCHSWSAALRLTMACVLVMLWFWRRRQGLVQSEGASAVGEASRWQLRWTTILMNLF